jgi:hypothetical protein
MRLDVMRQAVRLDDLILAAITHVAVAIDGEAAMVGLEPFHRDAFCVWLERRKNWRGIRVGDECTRLHAWQDCRGTAREIQFVSIAPHNLSSALQFGSVCLGGFWSVPGEAKAGHKT